MIPHPVVKSVKHLKNYKIYTKAPNIRALHLFFRCFEWSSFSVNSGAINEGVSIENEISDDNTDKNTIMFE